MGKVVGLIVESDVLIGDSPNSESFETLEGSVVPSSEAEQEEPKKTKGKTA